MDSMDPETCDPTATARMREGQIWSHLRRAMSLGNTSGVQQGSLKSVVPTSQDVDESTCAHCSMFQVHFFIVHSRRLVPKYDLDIKLQSLKAAI